MSRIFPVILLLGWAIPAQADISGNPTVIAGDILIVNGVRKHLHGIDAPEPNQVCVA